MGFNKKVTLNANPSLIPAMAEKVQQEFMMEGYDVVRDDLYNGGVDISITKGGIFKAILGMKTALKITLLPNGNLIQFEASVGIFGQQIIPTMIMLFVTWPVIITQIWGLIKQSKLDDKALSIVNRVILENQFVNPNNGFNNVGTSESDNNCCGAKFCTNCGSALSETAKFCSNCGCKL